MAEADGIMRTFDVGFGPIEADGAIFETGKVPLASYYSQERFDAEKAAFGKVWLNIAETGEIPDAGDWIVRDVKVRSSSIIIVRGKDMKIRAFHNICAHRGMKLVWDRKGRGGKFSCPYHAWMFDSAGEIVNIPDEGCFPHVDRTESGLTPVRCDTWEGFIFINLDADGQQGLADYLGPLGDRLSQLPLSSYKTVVRIGGLLNTNWKLAIEAQSEGYHASALHARTVSKMLSSKANPHIHPIAWEGWGAHGMKSEPLNPDYVPSSKNLVQSFALGHAAHMTQARRDGHDGPCIADHDGFNPSRSPVWGNDQFVIYPHFIFHVSHGGWWMHRFWPVAPGVTDWESIYHVETPRTLRGRFATQYSLCFNRDTLLEDNIALILQQEVMESGARQLAQFGEQEIQCRHIAAVHHAVAEAVTAQAASQDAS